MNSLDAVAVVLAQAGEPLHYSEITRRILEGQLWTSQGETPDATINARLSTDIKERGEASRFERCAPGMFRLRAAPESRENTRSGPSRLEPTPHGGKGGGTLSFTDAAEAVLQKFGHHKPMHYRVMTQKALDLGLVQTKGQTPEATLYAQVLTETKRKTKRGIAPRFVMHGEGLIGLTQWVTDRGLGDQIEEHNDEVRKKLYERLRNMAPADFEALVGRLLVALGFDDVEVTERSGDGGIDVRGILVVGDVIRTRMAVQVKRWRNNVQAPTVQQVRGSLGTHEQGLIITTSDFSKGAYDEAQRPNAVPVGLMNGEQLVALLVENDIGVQRMSYDLIELAENDATATG